MGKCRGSDSLIYPPLVRTPYEWVSIATETSLALPPCNGLCEARECAHVSLADNLVHSAPPQREVNKLYKLLEIDIDGVYKTVRLCVFMCGSVGKCVRVCAPVCE